MSGMRTDHRGASRLLWLALLCACTAAVSGGAIIWYESGSLRVASRALDQRQSQHALDTARRYLVRHPGDQRAILIAARAFAQLENWTEAETCFAQIGSLPPQDQHLRARGLIATGLWLKAAEVYEEIRQATPDDAEATRRLVQLYYQDGQFDRAAEMCLELAQHPAQAGVAYAMLGTIDQRRRRYPESIAHFKQAIKLLRPEDRLPIPREQLVIELVQSLLTLGAAAEAEEYLQELLTNSPSSAAYLLLGRCRLGQGDIPGAERAWQHALQLDPRSADAMFELARLAIQAGNAERALELLRRARELVPDRMEFEYTLGQTLIRLGRNEEGQQHLRAAQRLRDARDRDASKHDLVAFSPPGPQRRVILATAALREQNYEAAEALVRAVLQDHPDYPAAQDLLQEIQSRQQRRTSRDERGSR